MTSSTNSHKMEQEKKEKEETKEEDEENREEETEDDEEKKEEETEDEEEKKDFFNNNSSFELRKKKQFQIFTSPSSNMLGRRRNSLANGQIQLGLPKIKVSLAPELSPGHRGHDGDNDGHTFPPIDEHSEHHHSSNRGILELPSHKFVRRNSLPDSEYLRRQSFASGQSVNSIQFLIDSKRRISQVSNVVTQHFTSTIGWSLKSRTEIARQSRVLAAKYIRWKLRKVGLLSKKLHLQRLNSVGNLITGDGTGNTNTDIYINDIAFELKCLIQQLERNFPAIYNSVINQTGDIILKNVHTLKRVHRLIGHFIFSSSSSTSSNSDPLSDQANNQGAEREDVTLSDENLPGQYNWSQVAAFYAVTTSLAIDSVRNGHPEYVLPLIDSLTRFMSKQVAPWISQEGGWESLINKYREEDEWKTTLKVTIFSLLVIFLSILICFIF